MDIIEKMSAIAALGSRWILWLLVALSLLAITIVIERAIVLLSSRDDVARLRREIRQLLGRGKLGEAQRELQASPSFEARVAAAGLDGELGEGALERMNGERQMARLAMERNLAFLGTLGNNAPFIGLLGTVIGIVRAFAELERSNAQVSSALMTEIGEALIATAIGLLVALPAIAAFNLFQRVIRARLYRADALCAEVTSYLKSEPVPSNAE